MLTLFSIGLGICGYAFIERLFIYPYRKPWKEIAGIIVCLIGIYLYL